jgi:DNA modification methylase
MLTAVFSECVKKLEPGGRLAVNVANLGRRPYRSLAADVTDILQNRLRLLLRGEVVWVKGRGAGGSCAWGSFQRPGNPVLRDLTERVVIAGKGRFDRALTARQRYAQGRPSTATLSKDEFMEATTDVWEMAPESASRVGHPAPFPVELPQRLIDLYTYEGDLVLDPFMGSGTTAVAAVRTARHYIGYDTDERYVAAARARVAGEVARARARRAALPAVAAPPEAEEDPLARRSARAAPPPRWPASCSSGAASSRSGPTCATRSWAST